MEKQNVVNEAKAAPPEPASAPTKVEILEQRASHHDDKSLPVNWSDTYKGWTVFTLSSMSFIVNLSTVICAPASIRISQEFDSHSNFLSVFYITVWNLGEAIAPLYIGPLSERIGRLPVYHFYNIFFIIFTAITGFSNSVGMIVAFRFLTGMATTACLNSSVVGDMYAVKRRGAAMSIMSLMPLVGTAIGPILGGYVTQHLSWRWTFWLTAILTSVVELAMIIVYRETYLPYILRRRAQAAADLSGSAADVPAKPRRPIYILPIAVLRFLLQPFVILFRSRAATIIALYLSIIYAYLFLLAATMATVFQEVYHFSETSSGLVFLGQTTGMFIGTLFCRFTLDRLVASKKISQEDGTMSPSEPTVAVRSERRLLPALPGMVILPAALLLYGWALERQVHWMAPAVATGLAGFCLSTATIPVMNYLVDIFGDLSASAIAAVLPLRYVLGTFLPVAAPYMYGRLGYGWANSLLAFVLILVLPAPLLLILPLKKNTIWAKCARFLGNTAE